MRIFRLLLVLCLVSAPSLAREDTPARISVFSGLEVPRYASLRYDRINGRAGPGLHYPVVWIYKRTGLPVMVIRESPEWRKIRDPDGDETWVHKRMIAKADFALVQRQITMHAIADSESVPVAIVAPGVVVKVMGCQDQWCMVAHRRYRGWVPLSGLWGVGRPHPSQN